MPASGCAGPKLSSRCGNKADVTRRAGAPRRAGRKREPRGSWWLGLAGRGGPSPAAEPRRPGARRPRPPARLADRGLCPRLGGRRMEVGLSAISLYLAGASSPAAATTMEREPGSRAEAGEAVAASGAAAAAAFRDPARQVGEAPREGRPRRGPGSAASSLPGPRLPGARPALLRAGRPRCPRRGSETLAWRRDPSRTPPLAAPPARGGGRPPFPGEIVEPRVCERENAGVSPGGLAAGGRWRGSVPSRPLLLQLPTWLLPLAELVANQGSCLQACSFNPDSFCLRWDVPRSPAR